jgi:hypothetical protein
VAPAAGEWTNGDMGRRGRRQSARARMRGRGAEERHTRARGGSFYGRGGVEREKVGAGRRCQGDQGEGAR